MKHSTRRRVFSSLVLVGVFGMIGALAFSQTKPAASATQPKYSLDEKGLQAQLDLGGSIVIQPGTYRISSSVHATRAGRL
jgi:ABC-type phosphate transport system substrate-binding protein